MLGVESFTNRQPGELARMAAKKVVTERSDEDAYDVVAVGAHPDDVEIACGGTLAALSDLGRKVAIVDLTDGEPTPLSPSPEVRLAEAQRAAEVLGVDRIVLDLPNRRLFDDFDARCLLATVFRKLRPKVVIGFGGKTPLASPDHWQAMQITDAAVFYSRLTKWDEHFEGLPVHTVQRQLYFRLAFEPDSLAEYPGHFVQDITATLDRKLEAIACYETQFPPNKRHVLERVRAAAILTGTAAGVGAGEAFVSPRPIATTDLVTSLFP